MKAFVCVYQHPNPDNRDWAETYEVAREDALLRKFLDQYYDAACFYDWGDDPSLFCARYKLGDARAASWGVCRPDVRRQLRTGDFVVWFCAKADRANSQQLTYAFVGCSTVLRAITRFDLWLGASNSRYRSFYNVLASVHSGKLQQNETFREFHDNWEHRASVAYILFDPDPARSGVSPESPLLVADRAPGTKHEVWRSNFDAEVAELERLPFVENGIQRRLRTTNPRIPHRQIALHYELSATGGDVDRRLEGLRDRLIDFEQSRRQRQAG